MDYTNFYRLEFKTAKDLKISFNKQFRFTKAINRLGIKEGDALIRIDNKIVTRKGAKLAVEYLQSKPVNTTITFDIMPATDIEQDFKLYSIKEVIIRLLIVISTY